MFQPSRLRWRSHFLAVAPLLLILCVVLLAISVRRRSESKAAIRKDCLNEARVYAQTINMRRMPGKVTAVVPHYNEQRRQCLVEVSYEKTEHGGKSLLDEVIELKSQSEIALRIRTVGEQGAINNEVVSGAPVRLDNEAAAAAWFDKLMR